MEFYVICCLTIGMVSAQNIGTETPEVHPQMSVNICDFTANGEKVCVEEQGSVVIDSNWRWTHSLNAQDNNTSPKVTNCYTGNKWDSTLCPDVATCTKNCALDGADENKYRGTYGVTAIQGGVRLNFVTRDQYGTNVGSRLYYLESDSKYKMWKLVNKEFTFTVDNSNLDCGLNGALYFVEMDPDGGMSKYPTNKCGAKYGTGYCDAQCPHDMKWINGEANVKDWKPSDNDPNSGTGHYGTCCDEMDIWESNKQATAYTPHTCDGTGQQRCEGTQCGDIDTHERYQGICDKDGCDLNPFRMGNKTFYGAGSQFTVDSSKPHTVVTQFISSDGTDNGDLVEIKRIFIQDGVKHPEAMTNLDGLSKYNSLTDKTCAEQKQLMGDKNDFQKHGGMKGMGASLKRGVVLVMSLWDDHYARMLWLDSAYPLDQPVTKPGVLRGPCPTSSGVPTDVESKQANAYVKYTDVKVGAIGSTF